MKRFNDKQMSQLDDVINVLTKFEMEPELLALGEADCKRNWISFRKFINTLGGGSDMVGYIHPMSEDGNSFYYLRSSFETEGNNCLSTHTLTLPTTLGSEELCHHVSQYVQDMSNIVDNTKFRKMWLEDASEKMKNNFTQSGETPLNQTDEDKTKLPVYYRVYDFPNGYRNEAENMYKWLRHAGFTPTWDFGIRNGSHCSGITIPENEISQLKLLQRTHPARWGNEGDNMVRIDPQALNENVVNAPATKTRMRP